MLKISSLIFETIAHTSPEKELLVVATGQYLGEGFDCPRIDTLFLTFPVSFKGKIVQYVGRTLRTHQGKKSILVYDYFDANIPILSRMHIRRLKTYRTLGFKTEGIVGGGVVEDLQPNRSRPELGR